MKRSTDTKTQIRTVLLLFFSVREDLCYIVSALFAQGAAAHPADLPIMPLHLLKHPADFPITPTQPHTCCRL